MLYFGTRPVMGAFGWPTTELTGRGIIGLLVFFISCILLLGGWYRGFFI